MKKRVYANKNYKSQSKDLFHYTGCGLDNIYLSNGYTFHETPYGDGYSIANAEALHQVIAITLVLQSEVFEGQELAFLRKMLQLTQAQFADKIGVKRESYAEWECKRDKQLISKPADRLVRFIYISSLARSSAITELTENLTFIQKNHKSKKLVFDRDKKTDQWRAPEPLAA